MTPLIINYWAILAIMAASVILGFLWYGPLFGKKWMALTGISMPEGKPQMSEMLKPVIISLIGTLFMAYVLTHSLAFGNAYLGMSGISAGLMAAFWNWLGFIVPVNLNFVAWEGKPWGLFFIHSGYWLVLLAIAGVILSVW